MGAEACGPGSTSEWSSYHRKVSGSANPDSNLVRAVNTHVKWESVRAWQILVA